MNFSIDDIKSKGWLVNCISKTSWGNDFLNNFKKGTYFVIYYDMFEERGSIKISQYRIVYELNDGIYRDFTSNNIAFIQQPFDSSNYFIYSLLLTAVLDVGNTDDLKYLEQMYIYFKEQDLEEAKINLKTNLKGTFEIKSRLDFQSVLDNYYKYDKRAYNGMCMVYDLIEQYTQKKYNKSIFGGFITHVLKLVRNPNGGIIPEMANSTLRYLIIGEKGAGDDPSLKEAKKLLRQGNNHKNIYFKTGWFLNEYDNKWRKRIPDDSFKIIGEKLTNYKGSLVYKPNNLSIEKFYSLIESILNKEDESTLTNYIINGYDVKLGDYISFDEAFKYYPELANIYSIFGLQVPFQNYSFYYSQSLPERLVLIDGALNYNIESIKYTALHEIQHYIQKVEEFSNGGNPQLANLISLVGGASFRDYYISYENFRKRLNDVCSLITFEEWQELSLQVNYKFIEKTAQIKSSNLKMRYDTIGRHIFIDVIEYAKAVIDAFVDVCSKFTAEKANACSSILLQVYSLIPELDNVIKPFISKHIGKDYIELFELSLRQTAKTLERDTNYRMKGWTATDLYILNFATYQSMFGEIESRFTQQTSTLPESLKNYFQLYTSETIDNSKVIVYNESFLYGDTKNILAALETYNDNNNEQKYIIHTTDKNVTTNLLHETGHIIFDFVQPMPEINLEKQEHFCDCFVDYIHRKNIDPNLTQIISRERAITNSTEYDSIFESILFGEKLVINEERLNLMIEYVSKF
jgi:hypothetical protein